MLSIEEIWRDIDGHPNAYQVSSHGRIRSLDRYVDRLNHGHPSKQFCRGRLLKQNIDEDGYARINIRANQIDRRYGVHRLVAQAFIPNPDNLPCVNHIDGNKLNNSVNNLEWCTVEYNNQHANQIGLRPHRIYEDRSAVKLRLSKPVRCEQTGQTYPSCIEAERQMNLGSTAVWHSIHYNRPTKQGYTFSYIESYTEQN